MQAASPNRFRRMPSSRDRRRRLALAGAFLAAGVLAGCATGDVLPDEAPPPPPEASPVVAGEVKAGPPKRYCYRTLGTVDCYASRLPGAESRRLDWFDSADYD